MAYPADIFQKLNDLNLALQGRQINVSLAAEKINAMKKDLELWADLIAQGRTYPFTLLQDLLKKRGSKLDENTQDAILECLCSNMEVYHTDSEA